jgi:hypothetical protein
VLPFGEGLESRLREGRGHGANASAPHRPVGMDPRPALGGRDLFGRDGFGMGFIGLRGSGRVYLNDIAATAQEHNLFMDATGYTDKLQEVTRDVGERIRLVPHAAGLGAWKVTRGLALPPKMRALEVQAPGGQGRTATGTASTTCLRCGGLPIRGRQVPTPMAVPMAPTAIRSSTPTRQRL